MRALSFEASLTRYTLGWDKKTNNRLQIILALHDAFHKRMEISSLKEAKR